MSKNEQIKVTRTGKRSSLVRPLNLHFLPREIHTILLPFFVFGKKFKQQKIKTAKNEMSITNGKESVYYDGRPGTVTYEISRGDQQGRIKINGSAEYGVPMEFDHGVYNALLAIYFSQKNQTIEFKISDIVNILWISSSGKSYKAIHDSIMRLTSTTYVLENVFEQKHVFEDGKLFQEQSQPFSDEWFPFPVDWFTAGTSPDISIESERVEWQQIKTRFSKMITMRLFEKTEGDLVKEGEEVVGGVYRINLSDQIFNNIKQKFFKNFKVSILLGVLKRWGERRCYEILEFQRNGRRSQVFYYDRIANAIPLTSGAMNKVYIRGYLEKLQEKWIILSFEEKDSEKVEVFFPDQNEWVSKLDTTSDSEINQICQKFKKKGHPIFEENPEIVQEIISLMESSEINILWLSQEDLVKNLQYTFSRPKISNFLGFLRTSIQKNWAATVVPGGKNRNKKREDETMPLFTGLEQEKEEEIREQKKRKNEVFKKYIEGKEKEELESLYLKYGIPLNLWESTKKLQLQIKLFQAWEITLD